ncbi:Oligosaccaryltransferase-domain-containing protein [Phialemonium atrogriseum]|uniref:Dolichyl-diphosphooligosaccharide--protein glycosyltransferase subunit 4 n=1 Tax=Phialemonium atrogriseum TaxID=1093897 RepID=A0AAJ0FLM7_9PEZI|nr:Oligosaccaryltransferase-domain-containing protein [Phialemonium atrogriseum]KAK1772377.1 Oligosaccaryltransferase-domain-containing protein [Phialemonium atrogriseum]
MISDDDLYRLAIFLGSAAMILIVLYHYIEVNTEDTEVANAKATAKTRGQSTPVGKQGTATK